MKLTIQKRLASSVLKCSQKKVIFDTERLDELKESITKADIRKLVKDYAIVKLKKNGPSKVRARKIKIKKVRGQRKGHGSRKGKTNARNNKKESWMNHLRKQREFLKRLKEKELLTNKNYRMLYLRCKGGFFRNLNHLKMYIKEQHLIQKS
jgi:large subunit ribosomal protein L19e